MEGRKINPTFYPVIYGIEDTDDWTDERNWYKANPSLGHTVDIEKVRAAFLSAKENPAEENLSDSSDLISGLSSQQDGCRWRNGMRVMK